MILLDLHHSSTPLSQPFDLSTARSHEAHPLSRSPSGICGLKVRLPLVLTCANVVGCAMSQPNRRTAEPARRAEPRAVDLGQSVHQPHMAIGTYSLISGRTTSKPPMSANISIQTSPFVIPPSTLRCLSSVLESSFMLSRIARVWKALASIAARAMCAGVVYEDNPVLRI